MHAIRLNHIAALLALGLLAGCTSAQVTTSLQDGQLACAAGSAVVAMQAVGAGNTTTAILAKGASSSAVQSVCGLISGVAVSPPAAGVAGTVTVSLPPSVKIPLAG